MAKAAFLASLSFFGMAKGDFGNDQLCGHSGRTSRGGLVRRHANRFRVIQGDLCARASYTVLMPL